MSYKNLFILGVVGIVVLSVPTFFGAEKNMIYLPILMASAILVLAALFTGLGNEKLKTFLSDWNSEVFILVAFLVFLTQLGVGYVILWPVTIVLAYVYYRAYNHLLEKAAAVPETV